MKTAHRVGGVFALAAVCLFVEAGRAATESTGAPQTDDQLSARTARAESLVEATDPERTVFRVGETGNVIHIQSGMACSVGGAAMPLAALVIELGVPRGDDVGCDYVTPDGGKTTIFATRLGDRTLSSVITAILQTIRTVYPDGRPLDRTMVATYPGLNKPVAAASAVSRGGRALVTAVWISQENGWVVQVRATYPANARHDHELLAAGGMIYAQKAIHDYARPQPVPRS